MITLPKRVPRFEKIWCCIPLRAGVIMLVYLNLVISAIAIMVLGTFDYIKMMYRMFTMDSDEWMHKMSKSKIGVEIVFLLSFGCLLAEIVMTIVALIAIHGNKIKLLKIYLNYAVGITFFILFFRMFDVGFLWYIEVPIALTLIGIKIYYLLAVRSLFKKMDENSRKENEVEAPEIEMDLTQEIQENNMDNILHPASVNRIFFYGDNNFINK